MSHSYVKKVTAKGRTYNYLRAPASMPELAKKTVRLSDDPVEAIREAAALVGVETNAWGIRERFRRRENLAAKMRSLARAARQRSRARGRDMKIDGEMLLRMAEKQGFRCALTGIEFDLGRGEERVWRRPFAPSIDRIDCQLGYVRGNIRIVAACVNIALSEWGEAVFFKMAEAALARRAEREQNEKVENRGKTQPASHCGNQLTP